MNRRATVLVVAVFVLGLVLGALGMHLAGDVSEVGASGKRDVVGELTRQLVLNPGQQKQLETILGETRAKFHAISEQSRPQIDEARREGRQKIREILTAEQLPKFEAWLQRVDEARKKKNGNR